MDTITQALLGATVAEAGFRDRLGGRAVAFGAVCGLLPDFDVITRVGGEWASLVHHRGVSHSLVVLPLVAPLVGLVGARLVGKPAQRWLWIHLAFWALITHPLLDVFTTYGTQLLAPLSDRRFALDGVAIIDPVYTVPLAIAVFAARYRPDRAQSQRWARLALAFTTLYLLFGFGVSRVALNTTRARLAAFEPVAMRALVPIGLPLLRRVVARDARQDLRIAVWSPFSAGSKVRTLSRSHHPKVTAALATREGQIFEWFADGYLYAVLEGTGARPVVRLLDQRYGLFVDPVNSPFGATVHFEEGRVVRVSRAARPRIDVGEELSAGFRLLIGATDR